MQNEIIWSERAKECKNNLDLLKNKYGVLVEKRTILEDLVNNKNGGLAFDQTSLDVKVKTPLEICNQKLDYVSTTIELNSLARIIIQQEQQLEEYDRRAHDQEQAMQEKLPLIDENLGKLEKVATEHENDEKTPLNIRTEIKRLFQSKKILIEQKMFNGRQKVAYYDAMVQSVNNAKNHKKSLEVGQS